MAELYAGKVGRPIKEPVSIVPGGAGTPIPEPPDTLAESGREAWQRYWTVGRVWLSNEAHHDLMRMLCEALDVREQLRRESRKRTTKLMVRGSMGQDRVNPIFEAIDKADAKITDLFMKLRFQPAAEPKQVAQPAGKSRLEQMKEAHRAPG